MSNCTNFNAPTNGTDDFILCPVEEPLSWWVGFVENTYLGIITAIGVPGNILILLTHKLNREKTSTDFLIAAMAVNDLFGSGCTGLIKITMNTDLWKYIVSDEFCRFFYLAHYFVAFASPYLLAAIALDRYFKTCHPLKNIISIRTSKILCLLLSFLALLTGASTLVTFEMNPITRECAIAEKYIKFQLNWDMGVVSSTAIIFLIYIFSYINIAIALNKRIRLRKRGLGKTSGNTNVSFWSGVMSRIRERKITPVIRIKVAMINNDNTANGTPDVGKEDLAPKEHKDTNMRNSNMSKSSHSKNDGADTKIRDSDTTDTTLVSSDPCPSTSHTESQTSKDPPKNDVIAPLKYKAPPGPRNQPSIEKSANRTTLIMFLLTLIYAITYALVNTCIMTTHTVLGPIMEKLCKSLLLVNCISNPILFFCMSTKYRTTAKDFLKRMLPRQVR